MTLTFRVTEHFPIRVAVNAETASKPLPYLRFHECPEKEIHECQHTTLKRTDVISVFPVLQGSAETLTRRGGKSHHLPITQFLRNIPAKTVEIQRHILEL